MDKKKMGRPTDLVKTVSIKVRIDEATERELESCARILKISKSEVIRDGIHEMYQACKGDEPE